MGNKSKLPPLPKGVCRKRAIWFLLLAVALPIPALPQQDAYGIRQFCDAPMHCPSADSCTEPTDSTVRDATDCTRIVPILQFRYRDVACEAEKAERNAAIESRRVDTDLRIANCKMRQQSRSLACQLASTQKDGCMAMQINSVFRGNLETVLASKYIINVGSVRQGDQVRVNVLQCSAKSAHPFTISESSLRGTEKVSIWIPGTNRTSIAVAELTGKRTFSSEGGQESNILVTSGNFSVPVGAYGQMIWVSPPTKPQSSACVQGGERILEIVVAR